MGNKFHKLTSDTILFSLAALWLAAGAAHAGTDIRSVDGGVLVFLASLNDWKPVTNVPFGLRPGDRIRLKPLSKAELAFPDGTVIGFSQSAAFQLSRDDERSTAITLDRGRIDASVARLQDHVFEVQAPGAKVTMRDDEATVTITSKKVVIVEVLSGLAEVEPAVGPNVQVPEGHRLEVPPGKAPGSPVSLHDWRRMQRDRTVPAGTTRRFDRHSDVSSPGIGQEAGAARKAAEPELGADSLGLPKELDKPGPDLGIESLGMDPKLGPDHLRVREFKRKPRTAPALGTESLGIKDPEGPDRKGGIAAQAARRGEPLPISTDINPLMNFKDYGVSEPKPAPAEPQPVPKRKRAHRVARSAADPSKVTASQPDTAKARARRPRKARAEPEKPEKPETDLSPLIDVTP